jgi:hypothetical protein
MSSFGWVGFMGDVGAGAGAGVVHWAGGSPCGGPLYGTANVGWDVTHSRGNIAHWIGIAFFTKSVMLLRCDVKK